MKRVFLPEFDAQIAYHDIGAGPETVVYLAGLNMPSLVNFSGVIPHRLGNPHRAILIDYLGTGGSDQPDAFSHTMADHARTVAAVLESIGVTRCFVVGHSMGGTVAIHLALQQPDLVSKLIVCEGNLTPDGGVATRKFASFTEQEFTLDFFPAELNHWRNDAADGKQRARLLLEAWGDVDPKGIYRSACDLVNLDPNLKQKFFDLPMPKTFVYGELSLPENTGQVTPDAPDPFELQENNIQIAVLQGAGHELMRANPDGFVEILNQLIP